MEGFTKRHYATLIVGAGMQGLAYARVCERLDTDPDYLVLDANASIGGVWCKDRLYPQMHTNNQAGTYEFTDFPTLEAGLEHHGVGAGKHIPGPAVHEYLVKFANREHITPQIRLRCKVLRAEERQVEDEYGQAVTGWALDVDHDGERLALTCGVLAVATGTCNESRPVAIAGMETFGKPCASFMQLGTAGARLAADPAAEHVTVVGHGKSAYDAVYMFAVAGKRVTWAIRKSGHGARFMARPHVYLGPFKRWLETLLLTRPLTWLSPCVYGGEDGYGWLRRLLHQTRAGNFVVRNFFSQITRDKIALSGLADHPKLAPLVPKLSMFWHATQSGIFNYPTEILDLVRSDQVELVEQDVRELAPGEVVFADGRRVRTDGLLTATGWEVGAGLALQPEARHAGWGVPSASLSDRQKAEWQARHDRADAELAARFPMLADPPIATAPVTVPCFDAAGQLTTRTQHKTSTELACATSPWRLFRAIAPPSQAADPAATRNVVFLCSFYSFQVPLRSELAALWAYAYFKRGLARDPARMGADKVWHDTALLGRWAAKRHPFGCGINMPDVMLDSMPYYDLLMNDLGLPPRRRGVLADVFGGYYQYSEWRGVIEEWRDMQEKEGKEINGHLNGNGKAKAS